MPAVNSRTTIFGWLPWLVCGSRSLRAQVDDAHHLALQAGDSYQPVTSGRRRFKVGERQDSANACRLHCQILASHAKGQIRLGRASHAGLIVVG